MPTKNESNFRNWLELSRGQKVLARAERVLREDEADLTAEFSLYLAIPLTGKEWPYVVLAGVESALHVEAASVPAELARVFAAVQLALTSCPSFSTGSRSHDAPGPLWALDLDPAWFDRHKYYDWIELRQGRLWLALAASQIRKRVESGEQNAPDEAGLAFVLSGWRWATVLIALVDDLLQNSEDGDVAIGLTGILNTLSLVHQSSRLSGGAIPGWTKESASPDVDIE